jgi:hypothetical protein
MLASRADVNLLRSVSLMRPWFSAFSNEMGILLSGFVCQGGFRLSLETARTRGGGNGRLRNGGGEGEDEARFQTRRRHSRQSR